MLKWLGLNKEQHTPPELNPATTIDETKNQSQPNTSPSQNHESRDDGATTTSEQVDIDCLEGRVKFWNFDKGFGQITVSPDDAPYFVHVSKLQDSKWLVQGDVVRFRADLTDRRGPAAKDVVRLGGERRMGLVKEYENGEGLIEPYATSDRVRVRYTDIVSHNQDEHVFRSLDVGDEVEYILTQDGDGEKATRVARVRDALHKFAVFSNFDKQLIYLEDKLAEKEIWHYRHTPNAYPHKTDAHKTPILYNYINNTLKQILREEPEKVLVGDLPHGGRCAIVNSGLVTPNQEEIFAYFTENKLKKDSTDPEWFCSGFRKASDRDLTSFGTKPDPANYFSDPAFLIYDHRLPLEPNIDHIINDNSDRFPDEYRDNRAILANLLEGAIAKALKRVRRNYKAAVPQYYRGTLQLLIPLCLASSDRADLALVVERADKVYRASTVLTLDMAYNNARLLARPDREWLDP